MSVFKEIRETAISGCFLLDPRLHTDNRGVFVKTFHAAAFEELALSADFREDYYSVSRCGVLRGLHFQRPPHHHHKLVYCPSGTILDVVFDLRSDSPTFGQYEMFELSAGNGKIIYVPAGVAHGFLVTSPEAITVYKVTREYAPQHDAGVRWDSCGIPWPEQSPILSERDKVFPSLQELGRIF